MRLERWGENAIGLAGAAAVGCYLLVAAVHLGDNFHVDHVAGAWMGLAWYVNEGVLYPPLVADGYFGGTRYMPLGIGLNAAASAVTGEYVASAKVLSLVTMAALLTLVYLAARDLGCGRGVALGTVGAVIATFTAFFAGTTVYGDALAAALQLSALVVIDWRSGRRAAAVAGVLAALAFTAKLSALWGLGALLVWLSLRDRRRLAPFVVAAVATLLLAIGVTQLLSDGRFDDNVLGLGSAAPGGLDQRLGDGTSKLYVRLVRTAEATLILLPFAAATVAILAYRRRLEILHLALVLSALITLAVLSDRGTGFNHLIDLAVLVPLVVAGAYARSRGSPLRIVLLAAIALGLVLSLVGLRSDVHEAASIALEGRTPDRLRAPAPVEGLRRPYFSEDPAVAVQRDERPIALDSFMLLRILDDDPLAKRRLIARFDEGRFASVVLIMDLDLRDPWWSRSHLGLDVARAIDRNYRLARKVPGPVFAYRIYEPR